MMDGQFIGLSLSIVLGLISIALAVFFGLRGLRMDITGKLDAMAKDISGKLDAVAKEIIGKLDTIIAEVKEVKSTTNGIWDVITRRPGATRTVEGNLKNLGFVKIAAEPAASKTTYTIDLEKPELKEDFVQKLSAESAFQRKVAELFKERQGLSSISVYTPSRVKVSLPSTDPKTCTQFMNFFMKWLDSTYFESLKQIDEFEKSILT